ncbi:LamG-like jellyroll fold domain-containing protein [Flavobacterium urumqiense]|uniref:Por secretion system C-terminal sorting domain-containing protein n=1 Tax=Flavobacterium urumqiense TaxID=935224 RepID=A0A1H5ZIH7_9FLAO|nr:LamG-like jellyroll fold domain-containing protein [Flavobacterium urumqiense]SEG36051.1 Por secretion system C-terminal sorting domain-containing protein [Flavobacterium urumqiense]
MRKNYLKNLLLAFTLLWSIIGFAQATINVSYGTNPATNIVNGESVDFKSTGERTFVVTNTSATGNNSTVLIQSITSSNTSNFDVSSISDKNIKKSPASTFIIKRKSNICDSGFSIITVRYNNNVDFIFTVTYTNTPSISVSGGNPTQPVPNGQTVATSFNGTLFGTVTLGASATRNFLIVNTGTCPLTLQSITSMLYPVTTPVGTVSPEFSVLVPPTPYGYPVGTLGGSVIAPGGASYFVVAFLPLESGTKSAIISIPSNDATKSPYTFVISGEAFNANVTGPGGGNPDFRLWLKSTRGISLPVGFPANDPSPIPVETWKDLGSTGKNAKQETPANRPYYFDNVSNNINYNPVVKFQNNVSMNQFMYNTDNGYYTHETFIVMEPDVTIDVTTAPMTIISGTSAAKPATEGNPYPLISGEHTGIGFGDFSSRLTDERLWFNKEQSSITTPYYSVVDNSWDYSKVGIINSRNRTVTDKDNPAPSPGGVNLFFNTNEIGFNTSSFTNLGFKDISVTPNRWKGTPYNIGKNINSNTANGNLNGRVAEVISYASRVLDNSRPKIETYLAIKYGITLGVNGTLGTVEGTEVKIKDYLDSGGKIIWDRTANAPYNYNIAGIGKDVASDLYQKQSKSSNDPNEVTIGLGVIETTNIANINEFKKDRDFLVWGSDGGDYKIGGTNTTTISSGITTSTTRINKRWKIVETKTDPEGDVENVFVGIPVTAFSTFPKLVNEEYALIVSDNPLFRDGDIIDIIPLKKNMTAATPAAPIPVPILNKELSETYQTWYDFDGTNYFTFGKALKKETEQLVNSTANPTDKDFLVGEYALNLDSGSFTIGCWLRKNNTVAVAGNRTIMAKGVNLELRLNSANKIEALWDGVLKFVSNTVITDELWHNVVAVYYLGSVDLYIDGVLDSSTFNLSNPTPNFSRFSVGALYVNKKDIRTPFYGEIDEVNIWNLALTSDQINYLMNQEIKKYSDGNVNGKIIPQAIAKNEFKTIAWKQLKAYYDFNVYYGTTVEGLTDDRNFLRIKYLNKNKQLLNTQTAPLPYETLFNGAWENRAIWKNGSIQTVPNAFSIVPGGLKVNGNIVKIKNNVTSEVNKTVLGLFVEDNVPTYNTLLADNNTKIQVSHYLKLDGLIDLKGRSQLVQTLNSELDATSKGFIKRDQQGTVNKYNYNYWSSPVGPINAETNNNAYTVDAVFKDGSSTTPKDITWASGYDGSTNPFSLARFWLYKFENGIEYADWKHFNESDLILPSQGFTLKGAGAVDTNNTLTQNYTFVGKPNNGLINGNSVKADNLFLVGNPYPSALDAYAFINDNINTIDGNISGELYFWQHFPDNNTHILSGYTGGYGTLTLTGGTPPVAPAGISGLGEISGTTTKYKSLYEYIPVGQGFFVSGKLGIVGAVPIIFNNNQRAFVKEDGIDDAKQKISNTLLKIVPKKNYTTASVNHFNDNSNDPVYNNYNTKIRLGFNTANNYHRQLLIGFMDDLATDGLDRGYDGYQIDTQKNDLYFLIDDSEYTIQGVGSFDVNKSYPLGVKTDTLGNVQFVVDTAEFLSANQNIYIHDKETSIYYDITKKPANVNLSAGTYNTRFELTFQTDKALGIGENELPESIVIVYNNEIKKKLVISKNQSVDIKEVSIYNLVGQQLSTMKKVPNGNTIEIPFNVQSGVYLIKISTDKGVVSKKIIKQ